MQALLSFSRSCTLIRKASIGINFYLQISLGSRDVFLPELKGLQSLNATQVNEVCLCSDGSFYATLDLKMFG